MQSLSVFHQYAERSHFLALDECGKYNLKMYRCDPLFSLYKAVRKKQSWNRAVRECMESLKHWFKSWHAKKSINIYAMPPTHPLFIPLILLWWRPGKRIYFTSYTDWKESQRGMKSRKVRLNARFIVWYFDAVAAVNLSGYEYFQSQIKTAMVEHAVEVTNFKHRKNKLDNHKKKLVYIGRLTRYKRVDELARLCVDKGYMLDIIGQVENDDERIKIEKACGNNVTLLGAKNRLWIENNLCEYSALVLPSDYREPYGIVMLEAMAAGIVLIVSRTYGSETLFRDWLDYPLLAKNKNTDEIGRLIEKFYAMNDEEFFVLKKRLSHKAREYSPINIEKKWEVIL